MRLSPEPTPRPLHLWSFFCPVPPCAAWDMVILCLFTHSLRYSGWFPVLTAQPLHTPVFSRPHSLLLCPQPLLSLLCTSLIRLLVPIRVTISVEFLLHSGNMLNSEDIKMKTVKQTVAALREFWWEATQANSETNAKGSARAGSYCAVPSQCPPRLPRADRSLQAA